MKTKIFVSMLVILLVSCALAGATMSWFTATASVDDNVFTAGTVRISAEENFVTGSVNIDNWNPGDCVQKELTITNSGSKGIYLRGVFSGQWYTSYDPCEPDNNKWYEPPNNTAVRWDFGNGSENWQQLEVDGVAYWFYKGPTDGRIPGTYEKDDPADPDAEVELCLEVCLAGRETGNDYQGKTYVMFVDFEAIQASNNAVNDAWGVEWDDTNNEWKIVTP